MAPLPTRRDLDEDPDPPPRPDQRVYLQSIRQLILAVFILVAAVLGFLILHLWLERP